MTAAELRFRVRATMENALVREYARVDADGIISPSKERIDAARDMAEAVEAALGEPELPDAPSIVRLPPAKGPR